MLKICHIISGDLWAGAEVMASELLRGLQRYDDLRMLVILLNEGRLASELRRADVEVVVLDEGQRSFLDILRSMRDILETHRPDVIHSHRYKENILAWLASRSKEETKLVSTQHGMPEVCARKFNLKHLLVSRMNFAILSRRFDRVVAVSEDIRRAFLERFRFEEGKVSVIHNGIRMPEIFWPKEPAGVFKVGSCGRLFAVKDYPFMVNIARAVLEGSQRFQFLLAGDGPERPNLEALLARKGLQNGAFRLVGQVNDMPAFYQGLDLYLNTSIHEGIPMSILEAMSRGLPVVAPRVGGLPEIIDDGVEGFLIEERDPPQFAARVLLLGKDRQLWKRMAAAARSKAVKEFSAERMAQSYYELYTQLCGNHSS